MIHECEVCVCELTATYREKCLCETPGCRVTMCEGCAATIAGEHYCPECPLVRDRGFCAPPLEYIPT